MDFKGDRARLYDNLEWARQPSFIDPIVELGNFQPTDRVLDVGTGTGIMANAISPLVNEVVGLDISRSMLRRLRVNCPDGNIRTVVGDIRNSGLEDNYFNKIVARQVFHHILEETQAAVDECYRLLCQGGRMILAEGVPPSEEIKPHYMRVFSLKEKRVTFMEGDLVTLLARSGFRNILSVCVWQKQISIRNWLDNSGLPPYRQSAIFNLYGEYESLCRKAYNMTVTGDDYLIDMKQAIVVGEKVQ